MKRYTNASAEPHSSGGNRRKSSSNPILLEATGESQVFGPEVLKDAEKQVQMVHESLKVAQSR
jgi:hypothetical protein